MYTLRPHSVRLLILCWLALGASSAATAKKPPPDDPPPPAPAPVLYEVVWLDGLSGYSPTYANDVNIDGTIVGTVQNEDCTSRAVRWSLRYSPRTGRRQRLSVAGCQPWRLAAMRRSGGPCRPWAVNQTRRPCHHLHRGYTAAVRGSWHARSTC